MIKCFVCGKRTKVEDIQSGMTCTRCTDFLITKNSEYHNGESLLAYRKRINKLRVWVSENGSVVCDEHAGVYLASAIKKSPTRKSHITPLDSWDMYFPHLIGGLPCEGCVDWMTLELGA